MKKIAILGSTGSIGSSALDIVRMYPDLFDVTVLTAANNIPLLCEQIDYFKPELVAVLDEKKAEELKKSISAEVSCEIIYGEQGYVTAASYPTSDIVLLAMVGAAGLAPALAAVESGKHIALANKETLVMAGDIVMEKAAQNNVNIFPVDSEHSAIFQCLKGNRKKDLSKIFLTASGGPFRQMPKSRFKKITLEDALNHPTWSMGSKITIDSATLMNKGLEIIEAVHLFDVPHDMIEVLVHPQSIIHSMVGFTDASVLAQMSIPDMKGAISYAISIPERLNLKLNFPDFAALKSLTFEKPDIDRFPSLKFAFEASKRRGTLPCVMNAANEMAVQAFLEKRLSFSAIFDVIEKTMAYHSLIDNPDLFSIMEADLWAREKAQSLIS
ncbi:MAG: 1-deoxy-D-xylulose-5-phosphate reductoisomerase [Desulfobacteraceae bacterium]|nr:1-deoxy-D-xylulose-5-phosphate reductoisomerase [Desulfobacteraceae bacterium]